MHLVLAYLEPKSLQAANPSVAASGLVGVPWKWDLVELKDMLNCP